MLEGFFSHFVLCNKDHMIENVVCFLSPPLAGWRGGQERIWFEVCIKEDSGIWDLITWPSKKNCYFFF
jgi:hypothetical protein